MTISFHMDDLPESSEEAFSLYEMRARDAYEGKIHDDRSYNTDQDGNYQGSYEPERSYVTAILAFLDEYSIESDIEDITDLGNEEFYKNFGRFKSKVQYISNRFTLRKNRISTGNMGTVITLSSDYKSEVGGLLDKIRKIINQEVPVGNKKEKIFKKISSLQSEVDRDMTTVDAAFGRMIDLSKALGEAGGNIKPAIDQLERVKKIFWDNSKRVDRLPKPDRPKMIEKDDSDGYSATGYGYPEENGKDDEIPF